MSRRIYIFVLMCVITLSALAQLKSENLTDCYGHIRADITNKACVIAGYDNNEAISCIEAESLNKFLTKLSDDKKNDLYDLFRKANKKLRGEDISKYDENIKAYRKDVEIGLLDLYPEKREQIISAMGPFIKKIDSLSAECKMFNNCATSNKYDDYAKNYPKGHFLSIIPKGEMGTVTPAEQDTITPAGQETEAATPAKQKTETATTTKDGVKTGVEEDGFSFFKMLPYCIGALLSLLILFLLYKRYNKVKNKKHRSSTPPPFVSSTSETTTEPQAEDGPTTEPAAGPETVTTTEPQAEDGPTTEPSAGPETVTTTEPQAEDGTKTDPAAGQETEPINSAQSTSFAEDAGEWIIIGTSVQGNGHISMNLPCQDSSGYKYLDEGWGIAVTADGAGSAKHSEVGSAIAVQRAIVHFENLIKKEKWQTNNELPSEVQWTKHSYKCLKLIHDELETFAKTKNVEFKSLSSTIIVVVHSPIGLLVCHIGDGRAGYRDMSGEWHSLITPHKGEEANQTIFIPSEFWNIPFYEMSGVMVPEARVINEKVSAFTLMSDGCESTSWLCNHFNKETGKYYDPNLPHRPFFESVIKTLQKYREDNIPLDDRENSWASFIMNGNRGFENETDDKTMIVCSLFM